MKRFSLKSLTAKELASFAQDFAKIHAKYVATNSARGCLTDGHGVVIQLVKPDVNWLDSYASTTVNFHLLKT